MYHEYSELLIKELDLMPIREQKVKITLLDYLENPILSIEGIATLGSISGNGSSNVRYTLSLTLIANNETNKITDINNLISINKKIKVEVGIKNPFSKDYYFKHLAMDKYYDDFWFDCGIYIISTASCSTSNTNCTISITAKDKMVLLNGEAGGTFPASITFHEAYIYDEEGELTINYPTIFNIIYLAVTEFGGEDGNNIIISDLPEVGKLVMKYTGESPLYVFNSSHSDGLGYTAKLNKPSKGNSYKFEQDSIVGYVLTDASFPGELVFPAGGTVTLLLDKIVLTLGGNYEYFYDTKGRFIFREIKNYLNKSYTPIEITDGGLYYKDFVTNDKYVCKFYDDLPATLINLLPKYDNVKNDFIVWGNRLSAAQGSGNISIRYHVAIDQKPQPDRILLHMYKVLKYSPKDGRWKKDATNMNYYYLPSKSLVLKGSWLSYLIGKKYLEGNKILIALAYYYYTFFKNISNYEKLELKEDGFYKFCATLNSKVSIDFEEETLLEYLNSSTKYSIYTEKDAKHYYDIIAFYYIEEYSFPLPFYDLKKLKDIDINGVISYYYGLVLSCLTSQTKSLFLEDTEFKDLETIKEDTSLYKNYTKSLLDKNSALISDDLMELFKSSDYLSLIQDGNLDISLALDYYINKVDNNGKSTIFWKFAAWLRAEKIKALSLEENNKTLNSIEPQKDYTDDIYYKELPTNYSSSITTDLLGYMKFDRFEDIKIGSQSLFNDILRNKKINLNNIDIILALSYFKAKYYDSSGDSIQKLRFIDFCDWLGVNKIKSLMNLSDAETIIQTIQNFKNKIDYIRKSNITDDYLYLILKENYSDELKKIPSSWQNIFTDMTNVNINLNGQSSLTIWQNTKLYKDYKALWDLYNGYCNGEVFNENNLKINVWEKYKIKNYVDYTKIKAIFDTIPGLSDTSHKITFTGINKDFIPYNNAFVRFCKELRKQKTDLLSLLDDTDNIVNGYEKYTEDYSGQALKTLFYPLSDIIRLSELFLIIYKYYQDYLSALSTMERLLVGTASDENVCIEYIGAPCYDWREEIYRLALEADIYGLNYTIYDEELKAEWRKLYDPSNVNFIVNNYWSDNVIYNPAVLDYWLDFIDVDGELAKYSISNIGRRTKVDNNKDVSVLWNVDYPDIMYLNNKNENYKTIIEEFKTTGLPYCLLSNSLFNYLELGSLKSSAIDAIRNLLYLHLNYMSQVSITCLPKYYLEPNSLIYINSTLANVLGEFMIKQFTLPLTYNGTMSITCSEALHRM